MTYIMCFVFLFKQKTSYEVRISDWSSDVCSSDLPRDAALDRRAAVRAQGGPGLVLFVRRGAVRHGASATAASHGFRGCGLRQMAPVCTGPSWSDTHDLPSGEIGRAHV